MTGASRRHRRALRQTGPGTRGRRSAQMQARSRPSRQRRRRLRAGREARKRVCIGASGNASARPSRTRMVDQLAHARNRRPTEFRVGPEEARVGNHRTPESGANRTAELMPPVGFPSPSIPEGLDRYVLWCYVRVPALGSAGAGMRGRHVSRDVPDPLVPLVWREGMSRRALLRTRDAV